MHERRWSADGRVSWFWFPLMQGESRFLSRNSAVDAAVFWQARVQKEGREARSTLLESDLPHFSCEHWAYGTVFCYTAGIPMQRLGGVSANCMHCAHPRTAGMRTVSVEGPAVKSLSELGRWLSCPSLPLAKDCPHVCPGTWQVWGPQCWVPHLSFSFVPNCSVAT